MKRLLRPIVYKLPYISNLRANLLNLGEINKKISKEASKLLFNQLRKNEDLSDAEELMYLEFKFGGYIDDIAPTVNLSKFLNRTSICTGGDRFNPFYHDYSEMYSKYLSNLRNNKIVLLEVGILKGTGLAIWSEYFSDINIYGFDWDLGNINSNLDILISLGAFQKNRPKLFQYNQLINNEEWLKDNFSDIKFDVIIDDALHTDEAIINTFNEIQHYLSDDFVYFIEDNTSAFKRLEKKYPEYRFDNEGELTVITRKRLIKEKQI